MVKHKTDKAEMSRRTAYMHEDTSCAYNKYPPSLASQALLYTYTHMRMYALLLHIPPRKHTCACEIDQEPCINAEHCRCALLLLRRASQETPVQFMPGCSAGWSTCPKGMREMEKEEWAARMRRKMWIRRQGTGLGAEALPECINAR